MPIVLPLGPGGADRGKTAVPGDPCYFCEVDRRPLGEGHRRGDGDLTLTLVNWNQFELGQVYVIPRRHAPTLLDLTDEEAVAVIHTVRRIADALLRAYDPDGLNLIQNNGVVAGQNVSALPHARRAAPEGRRRLGKRPASHRGAGGKDPDEARP